MQDFAKNVLSQTVDLSGGDNIVTGFTHQPVVVLNPLALEGRGFRGLGAPDDVIGISDTDAHAELASLRGQDLASDKRCVYELICWCLCCVGTRAVLIPAIQLCERGQPTNHVMLRNLMQSSAPDEVMQTLFFGSCSCGGFQASRRTARLR